MRAIDTNVVARYLLADDPEQHRRASDLVRQGVYLTPAVLLELGWLLLSRYRQPRGVVAAALADIIDLPSVDVEDVALARWAIDRFADGADLADMLHLVAARPADSFATFDRDMARHAGPNSPVAVETLA